MTDQTKPKNSAEHIDTISVNDQPLKPQYEELDKFGAALAKSPAEVALVKKLDRWMMVRAVIEVTDSVANTHSPFFG